jgi:hypothetical protein
MPAKKSAKKAKSAKTVVGGLFISRAMRRAAETAAASEAEANRIAAENAADQADEEKYRAAYPDQTDAERAYNAEQAQAKATADARKKYKLKDPAPSA